MALIIKNKAKTSVGTDAVGVYVKVNDISIMYPTKQNPTGFLTIGFRAFISQEARNANADPVNLLDLNTGHQLPNGHQATLTDDLPGVSEPTRTDCYGLLAAKLTELGFEVEEI